jgi:proteasome lid subunit RPN8/RPN11
MNFHAHLCYNEVIGWLAGSYDESVLNIQAAFPVKEQARESNPRINVEMDPEAAFAVREDITAAGLQIVGWYHSHPTFENSPSIIDIENQAVYQTASQDGFVAGIISPFFLKTAPKSAFNLFEVVPNPDYSEEFGCLAPQLIPYEECSGDIQERSLRVCEELISQYSDNGRRVVLTRRWVKDNTYLHKIQQVLEGFSVKLEDCSRLLGQLRERFDKK